MKNIRHKNHCLLLFLLFLWQNHQASPKNYYYKQISIKEGLSQSRVQCILSDYKGYLWIGTKWGLNRYDGENIIQHFHSEENNSTIPSNNVTFIIEDALNNLWIGTTKGICIYDRTKDSFEPIISNKKNLFIASYLLVDDGVLLAGSGSLYKYEYEKQQLTTLYQTTDPSGHTTFLEMIRYDKNQVLLNTRWYGVYLFNLNSGEIKIIDYLTGSNYSKIFIDSYNRLWVSNYGEGLDCYKNGELIKTLTPSNSTLTYPVIHDIIEKDNKLWIATDGGGINILSLTDFSISNIRHNQEDISSFPGNSVYRLYKDPSENIWAGSIQNGLIGIREVHIRSFRNAPPGNIHGLSNQTINCFFEDSNEIIWVGTDGGGINSFDLDSGTFKHSMSTQNEKIASIVEYSADELLYFSFNRGFFILNKKTNHISPFIIINDTVNRETCINGYSVYTSRISDNEILFSAQNIYIYHISKKEFRIVATKGKDYDRNSPPIIATSGTRTYLTDESAILVYDSATDKLSKVSDIDYTINDMTIDSDGIFWLATTRGLVSYDPKLKKSELLFNNLFEEIVSVVSDANNRIWIGAHNKLFVYRTKENRFSLISETDGVIANEYKFNARILTKDNNIIMGGTNGMSVISSDIGLKSIDNHHHIEVLDVLLNGMPKVVSSDRLEVVKIPWNFSSLKLKVILNNKDILQTNLFQFSINNIRQDALQSNSNTLTLNHLPTGEYHITSSYLAKSGDWSPEQKVLILRVLPPWWKTTWAYLGFSIAIITSIGFLLYWLNKKREIKQFQHTIELNSKINESKVKLLTNISHELRTPLTLIIAPLKRIINGDISYETLNARLTPIYKQATQMKSIIDMVLDVRKLEEGNSNLDIAPHNLNEWIREVGSEFDSEFKFKNIKLDYNLDKKLTVVPFDKSKCRFVLSNFLMNAYKFSEPNTKVEILTNLSDDKEWARISIKDQGVGLNNVDIDSLFTDFYQGENLRGGTGIGLSYAKSIILNHSGKIGALANEDNGSTFYYEIPTSTQRMSKVEDFNEEEPNVIIQKTGMNNFDMLNTYSAIIVEDASDLRNFLKSSLTPYFSKVYTATNGKEALEQINDKHPDIIISDVVMPVMNGYDLCREVKTNLAISHIPIILLTSYHNTQNMYTGYKMGADAFLPKPFEIEGLLNIINNQLNLRSNIKARYKQDDSLTLQEISFSNADETFLIKLDTIIDDNISNSDIDVNFLASNLFVSRSLLYEKMKSLTGMGIIEYLNKKRIEKAVIIITSNSDYNISEVSEMVGFSSPRYFSKVFKDLKGLTPSQFRKEDQSNSEEES